MEENNYDNMLQSLLFYVNKGIENGILKVDTDGISKNDGVSLNDKNIFTNEKQNTQHHEDRNIEKYKYKPKKIYQDIEKNDIYNKKICEWIEEDNQNYCENYEDKFEKKDYYEDNEIKQKKNTEYKNNNLDDKIKPEKYPKYKNNNFDNEIKLEKYPKYKNNNFDNEIKLDKYAKYKKFTNIINSQAININCFKRFNIYNEQKEVVTNKTELVLDKKISISFLVKGSKNILTFCGSSINKRDAELINIKDSIIYDTNKDIRYLPILIPDKSIKLPVRINIGESKITQLIFTNTKKYYLNLNENDSPKNLTIYLMSSYKGGNFAIKTSFQIWNIKINENGELNWNIHANLLPK